VSVKRRAALATACVGKEEGSACCYHSNAGLIADKADLLAEKAGLLADKAV